MWKVVGIKTTFLFQGFLSGQLRQTTSGVQKAFEKNWKEKQDTPILVHVSSLPFTFLSVILHSTNSMHKRIATHPPKEIEQQQTKKQRLNQQSKKENASPPPPPPPPPKEIEQQLKKKQRINPQSKKENEQSPQKYHPPKEETEPSLTFWLRNDGKKCKDPQSPLRFLRITRNPMTSLHKSQNTITSINGLIQLQNEP